MEGLREGTQLALGKVLKYRGAEGEREMRQKAEEWAVRPPFTCLLWCRGSVIELASSIT